MTYWLVHSNCFVRNVAINYLWNCCLCWLLIKRYMICLIISAKFLFMMIIYIVRFYFLAVCSDGFLISLPSKKEVFERLTGENYFQLKSLIVFLYRQWLPILKKVLLPHLSGKNTICQALFMAIFFFSLKLNQSGQLSSTLTENEPVEIGSGIYT